MIHIIFILIKPFSESSCPVDAGMDSVEETTPIRIEMFHLRIKVITQNNFIFIFSKRTSGPKPCQQNASHPYGNFCICYIFPLIYSGFSFNLSPICTFKAFRGSWRVLHRLKSLCCWTHSHLICCVRCVQLLSASLIMEVLSSAPTLCTLCSHPINSKGHPDSTDLVFGVRWIISTLVPEIRDPVFHLSGKSHRQWKVMRYW